MSNFSATQSFQTTGLCELFTATDTSDYIGNSEGFTSSMVTTRRFTFRDGTGTIIKQETVANNVYASSVAINLLTLNITVELLIFIGTPYNYTYSVQNGLLIPCIGI